MSDPLTVERLGHRGDGIAPGPVYVARALPGELVDGVRDSDRIVAPRILTSSPRRVRAPCRHYRTCGGCALQHADDAFVADWKQQVVRNALAAHGIDAPFRPPALSPPESRRRAAFSGRRTKGGALVGFHAARSDVITSVPDCHVLRPELRALLPALEAITMAGGARKGTLTLAVTATETGADVAVSGGKALDIDLRQSLTTIGQAHSLARLTWDGESVTQWAVPRVRLGPAQVPLPPDAFLQATAEGEAALTAAVTEAVGDAAHVCDLFAGCGTFTLPLAAEAEVHAVEGEAALLAALDAGWRGAEGLKRITVETRDLFRAPLRADEFGGVEAVVIDPPRAGAAAQTAQLAQAAVPRVAAVSCNPVSFARDAAVLTSAGYRLLWVQVVDQFRWSPHVELAAAFARA